MARTRKFGGLEPHEIRGAVNVIDASLREIRAQYGRLAPILGNSPTAIRLDRGIEQIEKGLADMALYLDAVAARPKED